MPAPVRPEASRTAPQRRRLVDAPVARASAGAVAALLLGGATSSAQAVPALAGGLANSVSGWTLITALLVIAAARRPVAAAACGIAFFVLLNAGYTIASNLRGHPDGFGGFWTWAGLVVGAPVGLAAFWLVRAADLRRAAAGVLLGGIGLGDGAAGLLRGAGSTWYWVAVLAAAAVLVTVVTLRTRAIGPRVLVPVATAVLASAYVLIFSAL